MKTKSEIMTAAHQIARTLEGHYHARMSAALKIVNLKMCFENEEVPTLQAVLCNGSLEAEWICKVVSFFSTGFQSDIAENFLTKGYRLSDKQAWCVAYEYKKVA